MPPKIIEIKILNRSDIEEIRELWIALNDHHTELSSHFKKHFTSFSFNQRIEQLMIKEKLTVFLVKRDEVKIGYCIATCDKNIGEIDSLYIEPANRGKGIGEKIMIKAIHWLEKQECKDIRVYIAEGNENAVEFYRKFGFAERFTVMQMKKA